LGPGDNCPFDFGSRNQGYGCQSSSSNDAGCTNSRYSSCVSRIPSSGLICPGPDDGSSNSDHRDRFYNGCYASNASSRVVDSGSRASCDGYSHCDCSGSGSRKVCTQTTYSHPWVANDHSTWGGCIMDRYKDYDESNAAPSGSSTTGFPADNPTNCLGATVTALSYDWTTLNSQIDKMAPNGSTNQGIARFARRHGALHDPSQRRPQHPGPLVWRWQFDRHLRRSGHRRPDETGLHQRQG
jgi:hypothetical protein